MTSGAPLSPAGFASATSVSRETLGRFETYLDLLGKWQARVKLVGPAGLTDPWRRHFLDSAQLVPYLPKTARSLVDLGSGAGFPGLVLGILALETPAIPPVHLVESDHRKTAFLAAVIGATGARARLHTARAEALGAAPGALATQIPGPRIVTARALAHLNKLLPLAAPFLDAGGVGLFLKGEKAEDELTAVRKDWIMSAKSHPSRTDSAGKLLEIRGLRRVDR